jgi:hypothetical protein
VVLAVCEKLPSVMLSSVRLKLITSNSHTVGRSVCTEQCKWAPRSAQQTRMTAARLPFHVISYTWPRTLECFLAFWLALHRPRDIVCDDNAEGLLQQHGY